VISGRDRFQQVVTRVLGSGSEVDWVLKYGCHVRSVLDYFPSADFLKRSLRTDKKDGDDWSHQDTSVIRNASTEEVMHQTVI
jgi:hypothetical protein